MEAEQTMDERIAARVRKLLQDRQCYEQFAANGQRVERELDLINKELAQLTYSGPAPRVLPRTDEVPF